MALKDVVIVDMYLNPTTNKVEKITSVTPFGMTERKDMDWVVSSREKAGLDALMGDKVYRLNWDTDFIPMDSDEEEREHAAIDLFDKDSLTEEECLKYGTLIIDPTSTGDSEMVQMMRKMLRESE